MKKNKITFEKFTISRINSLNDIKGGNGDGNNTTPLPAPDKGKVLKCINESNDWIQVGNGTVGPNQ